MPLSFFTNSGNSYGSAIPFQRIVEPAQLGFFLNLEQAELLRIQRYNEGWRFYFGRHWLFKREDGEPLVTINYFRKVIDKSVEFLVSKGFNIKVPSALEEITKPFLDEVWGYNSREQLPFDVATMGAVTGDVFILITYEEPTAMQRQVNPFSQGRIRVNLLGSEQVYPTWDPLNTDTLIAVRIETIYYAERGTRQLDREDRVNHEGRQLYTKRFTQIITPTQIVEQFHGDMPIVKPNVLGEIPLVHIKNLPLPKEYYGLPDAMDLIDLQREMNEKATDISDSINYHSAPTTVIFGAKAKSLERGPRQIWSGLPEKARVETLKLEGELTAAVNYLEKIKQAFHELSDVPEGALGQEQAISNTSGVALHMQYQPLIGKTERKKAQYQPAFAQINYFILRIGILKGLISLPFDLCKECGGRIVLLNTGATTRVWNPEAKRFDRVPVTQKRCYHIDKQTTDFLDPRQMRLKIGRQYGFGRELKELTLEQIEMEIGQEKRSFWDYTVLQKALRAKYEAQQAQLNAQHVQEQAQYQADVTNATVQPGPEGTPAKKVPALVPPSPPPQVDLPLVLQTALIPEGEIEVPEEPELVTIVRVWQSPETGEVMDQEEEQRWLVPTGCKKPFYLNPFESTVEFNDVLPKDEALEAELLGKYQQMRWVDEDWCREQIARIAPHATEIKKRMKREEAALNRLQPQQVLKSGYGGTQTVWGAEQQGGPGSPTGEGGSLAPGGAAGEQLGQVPGEGGNPTSINNQLGG